MQKVSIRFFLQKVSNAKSKIESLFVNRKKKLDYEPEQNLRTNKFIIKNVEFRKWD